MAISKIKRKEKAETSDALISIKKDCVTIAHPSLLEKEMNSGMN